MPLPNEPGLDGDSSAGSRQRAVFLSYASEDSAAAERICESLRAADIEVWFDQSELRGGDAWDQKIRQQIRDCALFVPIISAHTQARPEGYFRLEWKLAVDRSHLMAAEKAFLVPVVIDATTEPDALVPAQFREVQWTRIQAGEVQAAFVDRIAALLNQPVTHYVGSPERGVSRAPPSRLPIVLIAVSVAAVVALVIVTAMRGGWLWHRSSLKAEADAASASAATTPAAISEKSVAVLPFVDMSEKKDQEYFSDGLSEELINLLTKIPDLHVPARTSSFYFKGKSEDIPTIARRLMVTHVLEGSVRQSGKHIRITAQLVRADNGYHLWSETYDRNLDDVFKVQDEIARAVVKVLRVSLLGGAAPMEKAVQSAQAHSLYLQARSIYYARADALKDFKKVEAYLRQALTVDNSYAPALVLLAESLAERGEWPKARQAVDRALLLDPKSPEAHTVKGEILFRYDWNWADAQAQFRDALALSPGNASAIYWTGILAIWTGRYEEGLQLQRRSVELDPVNPDKQLGYAWTLLHGGRFAEALAVAAKVSDLAPARSEPYQLVGYVLLAKGAPDQALAEFERAGEEFFRLWGRAMAYHDLRNFAASNAALDELEKKYPDSYVCAQVRAYRGDVDQAFAWLERGIHEHNDNIVYVKTDTFFRNIMSDPRYKAFLRKMKLPE
jgi:TolB-like protein/Flp pilus assembly protein TadD